jgi:ABC-type sugar transport system ATPase subunit
MDEVIRCRDVCKWFGDAQVLRDVDLSVRAGEIHVLLGENGAGKSTLVKVIAGLLGADRGEVHVLGRSPGGSVAMAQAVGVALVHQEPRLFPDLTVLENMWIDEPSRGWRRRFDIRSVMGRTRSLLDELGCSVGLSDLVADLSVADQQMIDMAAAMRRDLRVLIVDEPTASLTPAEVAHLFVVLRRLRDRGVAVLFIGHRLEEILEIGDRITVLRDGAVVATLDAASTDEDELVRLMVGRDIAPRARAATSAAEGRTVALSVRDLSSPGAFRDVSFDVHAGEVLGIGGLVGAGRSELLETIFGVRSRSTGTVRASGALVSSTAGAIRAGLGLVPEDRGRNGLVLNRSIGENIIAPNLGACSSGGVRRRAREHALSSRLVAALGVKCSGVGQAVQQLSGGNQQKVSLAKWLAGHIEVLMIDEPTRGVDIGSKAEIHGQVRSLIGAGLAVVMVSSDMRELLQMSDRILVMHEGMLAGELDATSATEEDVLRLASGAAA